MAASTAAMSANKNALEAIKKKKQGDGTTGEPDTTLMENASTEVAPTGEEAVADPNTTTDASGDMNAKLDEIHAAVVEKEEAPAEPVKPKKKTFAQKVKRSLGKGLFGGLFYKMPASGAKYNNSPINKNFGDAKARGFDSPLDLKSFGVGGLPGGVSGKPHSKTGAGGKFNN